MLSIKILRWHREIVFFPLCTNVWRIRDPWQSQGPYIWETSSLTEISTFSKYRQTVQSPFQIQNTRMLSLDWFLTSSRILHLNLTSTGHFPSIHLHRTSPSTWLCHSAQLMHQMVCQNLPASNYLLRVLPFLQFELDEVFRVLRCFCVWCFCVQELILY